MRPGVAGVSVVAAVVLIGGYCVSRFVIARRLPQSTIGSSSPEYTIADLGPGLPYGINNKSQVVGTHIAGTFAHSKGFPYFHGFLWQNGVITDMGTFGGYYSDASSINDEGLILGSASISGHDAHKLPVEHLCLWQNGRLSDISQYQGYELSGAGENALSQVYATGYNSKLNVYHLFRYANGKMRDLGSLGYKKIMARAVNNRGQVVGDLGEPHMPGKVGHAFLWYQGHLQDLGTPAGYETSEAVAINDKGQIAAVATHQGGIDPKVHTFLWQNGQFKDLGTLGGWITEPYAINNRGQVIGFSATAQNGINLHGFVWQDGRMKDINGLIPKGTKWLSLSAPAAINDRGQMAGDGSIAGDKYAHSYLLTPIK